MVRLVQIVGIVSPGAMGSAVGAAYLAGGNRVVATVDGRSARTTGLAEEARLELLPDLDAVVGESELVLSIVPPGEAGATAAAIAAAAGRTGSRPLVADWNAVSPATVRQLEQELAEAGLELVDGSISGGPPRADYRTRVYFAGRSAAELAAAAPAWIDARTVGDTVGLASAVKMCTASMYKGSSALLTHALLTAHAHGVLPQVLDDLGDWFPRQIDRAARTLAVSATKADATSARCGRSRPHRHLWASHLPCSRRWRRCMSQSRRAPSVRRRPRRSQRSLISWRCSTGCPVPGGRHRRVARAEPQACRSAGIQPRAPATLQVAAGLRRSLTARGSRCRPPQVAECGREDLNLQGPKPTGT